MGGGGLEPVLGGTGHELGIHTLHSRRYNSGSLLAEGNTDKNRNQAACSWLIS